MLNWLRSWFSKDSKGRLYPECEYIVSFTDVGVSCKRPDGTSESVSWSDLQTVFIETNDQGPLVCDVFWVLIGTNGGCVVPQGATGEKEFLDRLQELPGFDNDATIKAMCCTDNERFICWKRDVGA